MPKNPPGLVRVKGRPGYYYRDQRGGKDSLTKLSNDREEAIRRLRELRWAPPIGPIQLKDAARMWLKSYVATRRTGQGQKNAGARVDRYLVPALGYRRLGTLTSEHCREYRLWLDQQGIAPQTVAHILADLRCLLLWTVETGLATRSPFPRRILPRVPERPPQHLTPGEIHDLEGLPEPWGFAFRFLLGSGLRWGEAIRAQASDLDRGDFVVSMTKSGRVRRVPLSRSLAAEVASRIGRLMPVRNAQTLAHKAREVVPEFNVHRTRHTFAHRYLERGGSIPALKELMGHSDLKTTMIYLRGVSELAQNEARRIVDREDEVAGEANGD